jgi:hypothetical protein
MGTKGCKFCDKEGLLILPLRYAAVVGDAKAHADIPALPATLGSGIKDIALTHGKYAPRMVREGFIYLLQERLGIKYWEGYMVIEDAFLYKFDVRIPPLSNVEFSCDRSTCGIDASCIALDKVDQVSKAWFLFTPSPMTEAKLKEYKDNADSYVGKGKMQAFDPKAWTKAGSKAQEHSLKPELIGQHVAEWILYKQCDKALTSEFGKAMAQQLFVPTTSALAGVPAIPPSLYQPGRLGVLQRKLVEKEAAAFVMYDHIGITQELNDHRNDAFKPINDFMGKKEKGIDNTYRFDVANAIVELRSTMEKGVIADASSSVEMRDMQRRARLHAEPIFPDDSMQMRRFKLQSNNAYSYPSREQWETQNPEKIAQFEEEREKDEQNLIDTAPTRAATMWQEKYAPLIDSDELKKFNDKIKELGDTAREQADERATQHMTWLQSKLALSAFDAYDSNDVGSGEMLSAHVVSCVFGMEGSEKAQAVLTEWATATSITRENLLLRAFTRDQTAAKKEADKTLAEVSALVAGMTTVSAWPGTGFDKAIKGLVSALKSTDSALDEWMRNQTQLAKYLSPKHGINAEARFFYLISSMTRSVARKGMGGNLDMAVAARANAIMMSFLGDMAFEVESKTLISPVDPQKIDDLKRKHTDADRLAKASESRQNAQQRREYRKATKTKALAQEAHIYLHSDAQLKAKIQLAAAAKRLTEQAEKALTSDKQSNVFQKAAEKWRGVQVQLEHSAAEHTAYLNELKQTTTNKAHADRAPSNANPTNNYHQVRIGGVLAGIETVSLLMKLPELRKDNFGMAVADVAASAFSLGSIGLDMMYAHTKSVRELTKYDTLPKMKHELDVTRGGFKLAAGLLAATAGSIVAYLDWQKIDKEKNSIQRSIIRLRFWSGLGASSFGFLAAFSYAGPVLERAAFKMVAGNFIVRQAGLKVIGLSVMAEALKNRVWLLRTVAWVGWAGVAVTLADLSYAGYRMYVNAKALERWSDRCVFRKNKSNKPYSDSKEELKELIKAQNPGQEDDPQPIEKDTSASTMQVAKA